MNIPKKLYLTLLLVLVTFTVLLAGCVDMAPGPKQPGVFELVEQIHRADAS